MLLPDMIRGFDGGSTSLFLNLVRNWALSQSEFVRGEHSELYPNMMGL